MLVRKRGESASSGTGTRISTLLAVERRLNCARACRIASQLVLGFALCGGFFFSRRGPPSLAYFSPTAAFQCDFAFSIFYRLSLFPLTFNVNSIRLPLWFLTSLSTQIRGLTCVFNR